MKHNGLTAAVFYQQCSDILKGIKRPGFPSCNIKTLPGKVRDIDRLHVMQYLLEIILGPQRSTKCYFDMQSPPKQSCKPSTSSYKKSLPAPTSPGQLKNSAQESLAIMQVVFSKPICLPYLLFSSCLSLPFSL